MRRIALVCDWYHPRRGGIEAHLDGLATRLAARGDVVRVITSTPGPDSVNGIPVSRLAARRLPLAEVAIEPVAGAIAGILERERIEVVHSHVSIISPVALAGAVAAHRLRRPSVLTFHSFVPATPLLAGFAGALLGASHWRAVMTAVSARVAREVRSFAPASEFRILPNAIDTGFWRPGDSPVAGTGFTMVYAGRLQAKKRPLLLLQVLAALRTVAEPYRLRVVGTGPLLPTLQREVAAMGLADRVEFSGWVDRDQLREILRRADVFLSTATRESFGLAALEARATGVPVIAVRDSAVSDFITDGESGLLVDDDDSFGRAVARLASDHALRTRLRDFNRRTPVPYDWDNALRLHDASYDAAGELASAGVTTDRSFQLPSR